MLSDSSAEHAVCVAQTAAHELRTPLATMLALADSSSESDASQTLQTIRGTAQRSSEMVERLLIWSRLAHDTPSLEPVRLDLLTELCLEEHETLEAEATVIHADPRLIEVAIRDLVENARVHGGGIKRVVVGDSRVEVHDHGPGISDETMLTPFVKGPKSRGTGLGLALCGRIAERHGGQLVLAPAVTLDLSNTHNPTQDG